MRVGGQRHVPAALPPGMTRYPLYRRLGRPQGRSGRVRKISPPPGFDPRTVKPIASRYTDYATRPTAAWDMQGFNCLFPNSLGVVHHSISDVKDFFIPNIPVPTVIVQFKLLRVRHR